jgi:hypothetical protein
MTLDMPDACAGFGVLRFREREAPPLDREPAERERLAVLFAFEPFELERRALPFELDERAFEVLVWATCPSSVGILPLGERVPGQPGPNQPGSRRD